MQHLCCLISPAFGHDFTLLFNLPSFDLSSNLLVIEMMIVLGVPVIMIHE